jgi:hypothetical protein
MALLPSASRQSEAMSDPTVADVRFTDETMLVDLSDGRTLPHPITSFPRLQAGTPAQRTNWQFCGAGSGIHWPDLDENLSIEALVEYGSADSPNYRIVDYGETLALHEV